MTSNQIQRRAAACLAMPSNFRETALGFPKKMDAMIALIETAEQAKVLYDQATILELAAKRWNADTECQNAIAYGKTKAAVQLGKMLAPKTRKEIGREGGRGKKKDRVPSTQPFSRNTVAKFRTVAAHEESVDEFFQNPPKDEAGIIQEISMASFVKEVRRELAEANPQVETPPLPEGKYRTIVLDPPWPIQKIPLDRRPVEKEEMDYPRRTLEQIQELPIPELGFEDGTHVYLWVTHKFLPEGLGLFKHWGVRYECVLTWNKPTAQPLWWRFLTEHCLFGKIGTLPLLEKGHAVSFSAPQQKHSHKPEEFYRLVRSVSPEPRLTMFDYAREGFEQWGVTH